MNKEQLVNWFTLEGWAAYASPFRKRGDSIPFTLAPRDNHSAGVFGMYSGGVILDSVHPAERECDLIEVPERELQEVFEYLKGVS